LTHEWQGFFELKEKLPVDIKRIAFSIFDNLREWGIIEHKIEKVFRGKMIVGSKWFFRL
jgi:hypothetical protein